MLERLYIQNFQVHDKLVVEFDPGITTIVGPSDVGKSAIIRALRWVCTNTPGGDEFVRTGTRGTTVRLFVDGHEVTRRRGGDVNEYLLDGSRYVSFGRTVPEAILDILNTGEVCWQRQHDAPYWFSSTPGEVSRELNAVVNLGIIDGTLANVARRLHRDRARLEAAEERVTTAKRECAPMAWVPRFKRAVDVLEGTEKDYIKKDARAALLAETLRDVSKHTKDHERAAAVAQAGEVALEAAEAHRITARRGVLLDDLIETIDQVGGMVGSDVPDISDTDTLLAAYHDYDRQRAALADLVAYIDETKEAICQAEKIEAEAVAAMPDRCPMCGR